MQHGLACDIKFWQGLLRRVCASAAIRGVTDRGDDRGEPLNLLVTYVCERLGPGLYSDLLVNGKCALRVRARVPRVGSQTIASSEFDAVNVSLVDACYVNDFQKCSLCRVEKTFA